MDVIRMVEQKVEEKAKIEYLPAHAADVPATWADIGKARDMFLWQPKISLDEGVQRLVDWYQRNESWARDIRTS